MDEREYIEIQRRLEGLETEVSKLRSEVQKNWVFSSGHCPNKGHTKEWRGSNPAPRCSKCGGEYIEQSRKEASTHLGGGAVNRYILIEGIHP